jgi:serine/threonine protein phosphatase 1
MGDIHGANRALTQVLERANFDYENDTLIQLGDIADGWPEVPQCVEELLKIKNLIAIRGNHDDWLAEWLQYGMQEQGWKEQGGKESMEAYIEAKLSTDERHREFFKKQLEYYVDDQRRLFIHAGFEFDAPIADQSHHTYVWNRSMIRMAYHAWKDKTELPKDVNGFSEIFIGHSHTVNLFDHPEPVNLFHIWNLDQGAKHQGKLTMMNVVTKAYVQSDLVRDLYPEIYLPEFEKRVGDV